MAYSKAKLKAMVIKHHLVTGKCIRQAFTVRTLLYVSSKHIYIILTCFTVKQN